MKTLLFHKELVKLDGEILEITPNADGGILELGEQKLSQVRGETRRVKI